jgi:hypothetical protein
MQIIKVFEIYLRNYQSSELLLAELFLLNIG